MTEMTLFLPPCRSRATAMPRPAEIEVEECAAPKGSYSLSARLVKPERPSSCAQRADAVAAAGQDLVRIGLVADIPDQPVGRRVEDVVQRDRQFDDAEAGAEMPAGAARRRRSVRRAVPWPVAAGRFRAGGAGRQGRGPCRAGAFRVVGSRSSAAFLVPVLLVQKVRAEVMSSMLHDAGHQASGQRNVFGLVAWYDIEAAGLPFFLGLLDALFR